MIFKTEGGGVRKGFTVEMTFELHLGGSMALTLVLGQYGSKSVRNFSGYVRAAR